MVLGLLSAGFPTAAEAQTFLTPVQSAITAEPLTGVFRTSTAIVGLSSDNRYNFTTTLTSPTGPISVGSGITDGGSWDDSRMLIASGGSVSARNNPSNLPVSFTSSPNASAVSSTFLYNGTEHIAVWYSVTQAVSVYQLGGPTPVSTLFTTGAGITGMDLRVRNPGGVTNLATDLEFFLTTNTGMTYFSGTGAVLGTYAISGLAGLTDVAYGNGTLTLAVNDFDFQGMLYNVDFTPYQTAAIPEPATVALAAGLAALGYAAYRRRPAAK